MIKHPYTCTMLIVGLGILLSLVNGCAPKNLVSQSQEIEIGKQASAQIEKQYKLVNDPDLNNIINQMGRTIAQYSARPDLKYTFKILDAKDANAVSLPGGWIYVFKGLIDETKGKPDQLAGVIAHEIGHIAARHHADMIGRETYSNLLIGILTKDETSRIAGIFANITLLRWSRKHEYDADNLGIKYMYESKQYDPQGLINFFNYLLSKEKDKPSQFEKIFQTHPVTGERITRAQKFYDNLRAGVPSGTASNGSGD